MHLWVYNMQLPPYKPYNPCDGRQETVTIPSKPRDVQHTVCSQDGLHPSITCILYGCNHIRLRWPALLWRMMDGYKRDGCSIGQEGCGWRMDARGTVAQLGKRDSCSIGQEEWMDARGMVTQLGKRDADDGWMQEGRLLNWARGMRMTDGCKTDGCLIGQEGHGWWMDGCPIGWRDASVGEKDAGLGY